MVTDMGSITMLTIALQNSITITNTSKVSVIICYYLKNQYTVLPHVLLLLLPPKSV